MPDISTITLPSGTTYDIKDATARSQISALSGAMTYIGTTTTALTDGSTTNPIVIGGESVTAVAGNVAIYGENEFVFNGTKWQEFGSTGSLKALAFKDSATGNVSVTGTPTGTINVNAASGSGTSYTPAGTIGVGTGTANYTPSGTVGTPTITVTPSKSTKYVASSATGGGSVTPGAAASCTLPTWTATVANENLTIGWTAGSFSANTPTAVTLPSFSSASLVTGISSASSSQPSFSGDAVQLKFTGTEKKLAFSGNSLTSTGSVTVS